MPGVPFHAAAEACEVTAARLADARRTQATEAARATDGWVGPHRERFDRELAATVHRAELVERRLRHLADALRARARAEGPGS